MRLSSSDRLVLVSCMVWFVSGFMIVFVIRLSMNVFIDSCVSFSISISGGWVCLCCML